MKLHSAAHIVYYFTAASLGKLKIIGSNITAEKARFDFVYDKSVSDILPAIEQQVNAFIESGHEIRIEPDKDNPNMKWWTCFEWKMPCGGTHVRNSKEIGKIRLKRNNIGAGKERIEIYLAD